MSVGLRFCWNICTRQLPSLYQLKQSGCLTIISSIIFLTDSLALKKAFTALMTSSPDAVSQQLNKLFERLREKKSSGHDISDQCGELVLRLNSQFPGDVGCFCIYFLNHIVLQPGEAMFLGPNLPHAYLAGGNKCC